MVELLGFSVKNHVCFKRKSFIELYYPFVAGEVILSGSNNEFVGIIFPSNKEGAWEPCHSFSLTDETLETTLIYFISLFEPSSHFSIHKVLFI